MVPAFHIARSHRLVLCCGDDWVLCSALLVGELVSPDNITSQKSLGFPEPLSQACGTRHPISGFYTVRSTHS